MIQITFVNSPQFWSSQRDGGDPGRSSPPGSHCSGTRSSWRILALSGRYWNHGLPLHRACWYRAFHKVYCCCWLWHCSGCNYCCCCRYCCCLKVLSLLMVVVVLLPPYSNIGHSATTTSKHGAFGFWNFLNYSRDSSGCQLGRCFT